MLTTQNTKSEFVMFATRNTRKDGSRQYVQCSSRTLSAAKREATIRYDEHPGQGNDCIIIGSFTEGVFATLSIKRTWDRFGWSDR